MAFVYLSYSSLFSAFLYVLLSHCGDFMSKKDKKNTANYTYTFYEDQNVRYISHQQKV